MDSSNKEWALACAARGWYVFPSEGKMPKVKWSTDATLNPGTIETWWTQWPTADVCIKTGADSNLVVVDWDAYKQANPSECPLADLPETYWTRTPKGGWHFYFTHPGYAVANSASKLAEYVDVRGDGGMVVAYVPANPIPLVPAPEAWLTKRQWVDTQVTPIAPPYAGEGDGLQLAVDLLQSYAEAVLTADEGTLNVTLWRLASDAYKMVANGELREESVTKLMVYVGREAGHPEPGCTNTVLSARNRGMLEPTSCVDLYWKGRGRA